ncbi:MAG: hypothetical protein OXT67_07025 [Zetaproteobacteria bacterium]|nr:hypothetical protein [Zetaproteobacteria bacterium]
MKATHRQKVYLPMARLILLLLLGSGCDLYHHQKCEWFLEPDFENPDIASKGYVAICVRNHKLNKQKCFLEMKLQDAERDYQKPITYSSLKFDVKGFPRKIRSYEICGAKKE